MTKRGALAFGGAGPNVVALGGGHGLAATLKALRRVTDQITAVVGVADDGGSSGRLRDEYGVLPPGDLRMALAALCGDDTWGRTWSKVVQHRFGGSGDLAGHSLGNLLIYALWEQTKDPVVGLDWVGALLEAQGRVLPCSTVPLQIIADVEGLDPANVEHVSIVRGQEAVATTPGTIVGIRLEPADAPVCLAAIEAVERADVIVLGPGSWYTSVVPHLLLPDLAAAITNSSAKRIVVLNLDPSSDTEMSGLSVDRHLMVLMDLVPGLALDAVIADPRHVDDLSALTASCARIGAELVLNTLTYPRGTRPGEHDPDRLAVAIGSVI